MGRQQLFDLGFSSDQIYRRTQTGRWVRLTRGVYNVLPRHDWPDPYDITRRQAAWTGLLALPGSAATGLCALALHGVWGLPRILTPEVGLTSDRHGRGRKNVRVRRFQEFATVVIQGRRVAVPAAALVQALPGLRRDTAVSILDSAGNRGLIGPESLAEIGHQLRGKRGARKVRPWLELVSPLAQSPFETLARLQCLDAGLPPPTLQVSVWDEWNRAIAHGDLGWERGDGTWVLIDLDGRRYHEDPKALLVDRRRQNAIALTGRHTHLRFAWEDLRTGTIPETITRALRGSTARAS